MAFPDADLRATCQRFLSGHPARTQHAWLEYLATSPAADFPMDFYGNGPAIELLEREVAALLGKEAALFVHKGVVAQQMALPSREGLQKAVHKLAETERTWLFGYFVGTQFPALTMGEITIGEAAEQWTTQEMVAAMKTLLDYAQEEG